MVDILYNVMARPIATDPDKKDVYHVDKAPKDARAKKVNDDDPDKEGNRQQEPSADGESQNQQQEHSDQALTPKKQGKGKYIDKDGKEHLDFYA